MSDPKEELLEITAGLKLTLSETFDRSLRVPTDFKEIHAFHKKEFPDYPLEAPPKSADIAILSFSELESHKLFLTMLQKALEITFKKDVLLVGKTGWEQAKFVIALGYGLSSEPQLAKQINENAGTLNSIPLFTLSDLSVYQNEPKQKRALWKLLCQQIAGLKLPKSS